MIVSPDRLSLSMLLLRLDRVLNAVFFSRGPLSLVPSLITLLVAVTMLPLLPATPSFPLAMESPLGVCGQPPGITSKAGVGWSDEGDNSSLEGRPLRLLVLLRFV